MTEEQKRNLELWKGGDMITAYAIIAVSAFIIGGASTYGVMNKRHKEQPVPVVVSDVVAKEQQEVIKQLTNLDLLVEPCESTYIKDHGDLLCREMYCRVMSRGIDSQTAGQECEQIANVANSKLIIDHCEKFINDQEECYEKYRERK